MNQLIKYVIGIDVAKDKLDACLTSVDVQLNYKVKATHKFTNASKRITASIPYTEPPLSNNFSF
jgi:hypothetical protein